MIIKKLIHDLTTHLINIFLFEFFRPKNQRKKIRVNSCIVTV